MPPVWDRHVSSGRLKQGGVAVLADPDRSIPPPTSQGNKTVKVTALLALCRVYPKGGSNRTARNMRPCKSVVPLTKGPDPVAGSLQAVAISHSPHLSFPNHKMGVIKSLLVTVWNVSDGVTNTQQTLASY